MNRSVLIHVVFVILILTSGCGWDKPFAGQTGLIKDYRFRDPGINLILQLDELLLQNPNFEVEHSEHGYYVYVKHIPSNNKFGIRVFKDVIKLIFAGENGKNTQIDYYLESGEKKRLISSFEDNIIAKVLEIPANDKLYVQSPFLLTSNKMNNYYTEFIFTTDTLLQYALPTEFDSLDMDYFENLIQSYGESRNTIPKTSQFCNLFSIDEKMSGYIDHRINVTRLYRKIGLPYTNHIVFDDVSWKLFIETEKLQSRISSYRRIREARIEKGYLATSVYHDHRMAYWMNTAANLNCNN